MKRFKSLFDLALGLMLLMSTSVPLAVQASPSESQLLPRWVPSKPARTRILEGQSREVIEVKFVEGSFFRLRDGEMTTLEADSLVALESVLNNHPVQTIERLFTQSEEVIEAEKVALEADTNKQMPDLNLWYRMRVADGTDPEALIDALNALSEVEIAYPAPLPAPPPPYSVQLPVAAHLLTPDYTGQQGYLNPATGGIDAIYAWTLGGGTGSNTTIVDIEYSFNNTHEDLPSIPVIGGQMWNGYGDDHGTAVWGELVAMNNSYGVTGIAYGSTAKFSSACTNSVDCGYNPADAINIARTNTGPGDVILIEQQASVCGTSDFGPLEWYQSVYDATLVATAAGRIVVAAAGNGNVDLDSAGCNNKFDRNVRDSGAIIVGAGAPPGYPQTDRSRLSFSSYGSRVDLQGWGAWVYSTGYGNLYQGTGKNQWYTSAFSGTSSASPIVAGAAALLSSIYQQMGEVKTPVWIRSKLVDTGSPQQAHAGYPITENIGPRPDLKRALPIQTYTLTVNKTGTGSGTVTSSPSGIDCGSTCSASYAPGTTVTLTPTPTSNYHRFTDWSGACTETGACVVTMDADKSVTANFEKTTFADVPFDHQHWRYIEALYDEGYTAGCLTNPLKYCPDTILNRGMMAVFTLKGAEGVGVNPPKPNLCPAFSAECVPECSCPSCEFNICVNSSGSVDCIDCVNCKYYIDKPEYDCNGCKTDCDGCSTCYDCKWNFYCESTHMEWAARWAEYLYDKQYTAGKETTPFKYKPCELLPRVEASVFVLRIMHGIDYEPPPAEGTLFADTEDFDDWAIKWGEQAYRYGLLPDCGVENGKPKFCPDQEVNRAWAAYMVVQAKDLHVPFTLSQPSLVSPADGSTPAGSQPTLVWDVIAGATWYHVQVADTGTLGGTAMEENEWVQATDACSGSQCSWQVDDALTNGSYDWRVRGRDALAHLSPWSSVWDFNISP